MGMEFRIGVVNETNDAGGAGADAGSAANTPVALTRAEWEQLVKQFGQEQAKLILQQGSIGGVPLQQAMQPTPAPPSVAQDVERIEETLLPAEAAAAPKLAQDLRARAAGEPEIPPSSQPMSQRPVEGPQERGILPPLEEMQLERQEERGILPPLEEMRLEAELPGAEAERQQRAGREKAARENVEQGPAEIAEPSYVIDPAVEQAERQREQEKHNARVRAARENLRDLEEGREAPHAVDPAAEKRAEMAGQAKDYLNSGARVAAQAGLGTVGQALGGAADVAVGLATGDPFQAVAGAMQLATAGADAAAGALDTFTQTVDYVGQQLGSFAHNDYVGMFGHAVDEATAGVSKIPIVGEVYAGALEAAVAPLRNFIGVVDSFVERGKELAGYSGALSQAEALSDVRGILSDLTEAQALGDDLARLTDAQSELSNEMREMLLPIKEFIVRHLADFLETIVEYFQDARTGIALFKEFSGDVVQLLTDIATLSPAKAKEHLKEATERIREILRERDQRKDDELPHLETNLLPGHQEAPIFWAQVPPPRPGMWEPTVPF